MKRFLALTFSLSLLLLPTPHITHAETIKTPIILVDPGHGGIDGGTSNSDGSLLEKDLNLSLSKQLVSSLRQDGIRVEMSRELDEDVTRYAPTDRGWGRHFRDMYGRVEVAKQKEATLIVSLHGNHGGTSSRGAIVFYKKNSPESYLLASDLQMCLNEMSHTFHVPLPGNFYIVNKPGVPSVLVEYGFLSNPNEVHRLLSPDYQKQLVDTLADGIRFFLISYHIPTFDKGE